MRMMCDAYLLDSASLGSPGVDELRWHKPVHPGDTLSMRMEIVQARLMNSRPGVGLVQTQWTVLNQDHETVMTMKGWGMYGCRPPAA
jgi:acyl dehydratase